MTTITFYARGDSSSANNAALNAQGTSKTPTTELVFESTIGGDIVLDYHNGDPDPTTVVLVDGVERSFWVEFSGTLPHTNKLKNVNGEDLRGQEIVVITTDDGQRYFFLTNGTTSFATMDAFPNGAHDIEGFTSGGSVYICFVEGSRILTPGGEVAVEKLRPGDLVVTASEKAEPILWVSKRTVSPRELRFRESSRPVRIGKDSFGPGLPNRDLWLSRMHRVLIRGWQPELLFGQRKIFVHASHLPPKYGEPAQDISRPVTYHHILLHRHEVLVSNGLETESLFPGDLSLACMEEGTRSEMISALARQGIPLESVGTALPSLRRWEAQMLFGIDDFVEPGAEPEKVRQHSYA